ncbi:hypothetical protein B0H16DRAFT_324339 [Mycena metata]|uniref:DUF6593 domain-containing protein n=1 Tax=Mycena metata TaxID=1033252 RepID=A0AAD7HPB6_9AGAR|nr:hypothetical protein B0H16DRAFT_324339 [Mycena metata]
MDSELTLVDPTPPVFLDFSPDSMINTTICRNSRAAYTISTELQGSTTELRRAGASELLARICRKEVLPDTVSFPNINNGKDLRRSKWLRRCTLPDGRYGSPAD